jgi:hypothetical protein
MTRIQVARSSATTAALRPGAVAPRARWLVAAAVAVATLAGGCQDAPARVAPLSHTVAAATEQAVAWAARTAEHLSSTLAQPLELVPTVALDEETGSGPSARRVTSQQKAMVALPAPRKPRPAPVPPPPVVEEPAVEQAPPAPEVPAVSGAGNATVAPSGAGRATAQPSPAPLAPRVSREAPPRRREGGPHLSTPVIVASSVGAIGLAMGAIGAGFGDGPVEPGFAVAGAGIGAVGLATAGILLLIQPDEPEPRRVRVGVGPGAVAVRGGF